MAKYEARLTSAGFLGDLTVRLEGRVVHVRGLRARRSLMTARLVGQWTLAAVGLGVFVFGSYDLASVLIAAAVAYSFVMYLALWWTAVEDSVSIMVGSHTEAKTGWSFRWFDIFWLLNGIAMLSLLLTASSSGGKIVSFDGPAIRPGDVDVRYLLEAKAPVDAVVLVATLLGARVDALEDRGSTGIAAGTT